MVMLCSDPLSTINIGDLVGVTMTTADNCNMISKQISCPVNRLPCSPVQSSFKTPKTTKKESMVSAVAATTSSSIQTKQQTIHVKEEVETVQFSSSKKEMRKDMHQLNSSPELSSPTVPKELFLTSGAYYEDKKRETTMIA